MSQPRFMHACFVLFAIVALLLAWSSLSERADLVLFDQQVRILREHAPQAIEDRVVLVGIDEATFAAYDEPFALWHRHLGDFLRLMAETGPAVVGFDVAFPDRSFNSVLPGGDRALLGGLLACRGRVPVVVGITLDQAGEPRRVYPPYLSLVGRKGQGFVVLPVDRDRVVRRFEPDYGGGDSGASTLIGAMLRVAGESPEPGLINYLIGESFDYLSFNDLVQRYRDGDHEALRERLAGRYILVGSVLPFEDRHLQPVNLVGWEPDNHNIVPGVAIHGQALRSGLAGRVVQSLPTGWTVIGGVALLFTWWLGFSAMGAAFAYVVLLMGLVLAQSWLLIGDFYLPISAWLLTAAVMLGGRQALDAGLQLLERRRLRAAFSGYVSPAVMDEIISGHLEPGVHGTRRKLAVLFSDIRGFTSLSEHMDPEEIIQFLNRYLAEMTEAIQMHGGTIDKFMGDGIMAFFGAPKPHEDPGAQAFAAAHEKLRRLEGLNATFKEEGSTIELKIGIGLHFGEAVVGNIGSSDRNEYTAIGDVVNTASRLEGLTKSAGYPVVLSEQMAQTILPNVVLDDIGELPVKGRAPVHVYGWPAKKDLLND